MKLGSQSAGWFPLPKGGGTMSTYEILSLMIAFATLIVTFLGTKK